MDKLYPNIPSESWWLETLYVAESKIHGQGVFTKGDITEGSTVIVWGGVVVSIENFKNGVGLPHTNVGIDENMYLVAKTQEEFSIDDYMNHSCDPNLWLADEITLTARRNIFAGEELTIDYAMELADESYIMKVECNCNTEKCRKTITGRDWRIISIQEFYRGHFSPFINRRIAMELNSRDG